MKRIGEFFRVAIVGPEFAVLLLGIVAALSARGKIQILLDYLNLTKEIVQWLGLAPVILLGLIL